MRIFKKIQTQHILQVWIFFLLQADAENHLGIGLIFLCPNY